MADEEYGEDSVLKVPIDGFLTVFLGPEGAA
jgi:hypothetical protein